MDGEELDEAFERLGEAEVVARVGRGAYDHYTRAFALRWLGQRALVRVAAEEKVRRSREAAEAWGLRARRLMIVAALTICALAALVIWQSRLRAVLVRGRAVATVLVKDAAHAGSQPRGLK